MKRTIQIALALGALAVTAHPASAAQERPRMLLVFGPSTDNPLLTKEFAQLQQDSAQIDGEDIDVVYIVGDHNVKLPPPDARVETAANMRKRYHVDADGFRIVLLGDDGWEKHRWDTPTPTEQILLYTNEMPKKKTPGEEDKH
jgi:hypothetical protein